MDIKERLAALTAQGREIAGTAINRTGDTIRNLGQQYMQSNAVVKTAIPLGAGLSLSGIYALMSYRDSRPTAEGSQRRYDEPVHNSYRAPRPTANDAYSNISELAKAERRVQISKKVLKEDEALDKLRTEYDLLRAEGNSLGGIYRD